MPKIQNTIIGVNIVFSNRQREIISTPIPEQFSFEPVIFADVNTFYMASSPIEGLTLPATVTVLGGQIFVSYLEGIIPTEMQWSDGPLPIQPNQIVYVRNISSSEPAEETIATVEISGVTANFVITTDFSLWLNFIDDGLLHLVPHPEEVAFEGYEIEETEWWNWSDLDFGLGNTNVTAEGFYYGYSPINMDGTLSIVNGEFGLASNTNSEVIWSEEPLTVNSGDFVAARVFHDLVNILQVADITLSNSVHEDYSGVYARIDTIPETPFEFYFEPVSNATILTDYIEYTSVFGFDGFLTASIDPNEGRIFVSDERVDEESIIFWDTEFIIQENQYIYVKQTSSPSYNTITNALVLIGDTSGVFTVTTEQMDNIPDPFDFGSNTVDVGEMAISAPVMPEGFNEPFTLTTEYGNLGKSLTNEEQPTFWSDSLIVFPEEYVWARGIASGDYNTTIIANMVVSTSNTVTPSFTIITEEFDDIPDPFDFGDITHAPLSTLIESRAPVTITGITDQIDIFTISPVSAQLGLIQPDNSVIWTNGPATISEGQELIVRNISGSDYSQITTATFQIGGVRKNFRIITKASEIVPDPNTFVFEPINDADLNTTYTSEPVLIEGISSSMEQVFFATDGFIAIANTLAEIDLLTPSDFSEIQVGTNGMFIVAQANSSSNFANLTAAQITVGGYTTTFDITTAEADDTPDPFTFDKILNAIPNTVYVSNVAQIVGINVEIPISISEGEILITYDLPPDNNTWVTSSTISNGAYVFARRESAEDFEINVFSMITAGGGSARFDVETAALDDEPEIISFAPIEDAEPNTIQVSDGVKLVGVNVPVIVSVESDFLVGKSSGINTLPSIFASSIEVEPEEFIFVQGLSANDYLTSIQKIVQIGELSVPFEIITREKDITPDAFTFNPQLDVPFNDVRVSNQVQITGIDDFVELSIGNGEYFISNSTLVPNGATWSSANTTISVGQYLSVRHISASDFNQQTITAVNVGDFSTDFRSTTIEIDEEPNQLVFTPQYNLPLDTFAISETLLIEDFNTDIDVSLNVVPPGIVAEFGITTSNSTPTSWTTGTINISPNDTNYITLRVSSGNEFGSNITVTAITGTTNSTFEISSEELDIEPQPFTISPNPIIDVLPDSEHIANVIEIIGINQSVVANSDDTRTFFSTVGRTIGFEANAIVEDGDSVWIKTFAPSEYDTEKTINVTIGQFSAPWTIRTAVLDDTPDLFVIPDYIDAEISTFVLSEPVQITGINSYINVSTDYGSVFASEELIDPESIRSFEWSQNTQVNDNYYFYVRAESSNLFEDTKTANVSVGEFTATFNIITEAEDLTPDAFSFATVEGILPNQIAYAYSRITGINSNAIVTTSVGEVFVSDALDLWPETTDWDTTAEVRNDQFLYVRMPASDSFNTSKTTIVSVGTESATWTTITAERDDEPDGNPTFTNVTNAERNVLTTSNGWRITGVNATIPVSTNRGEIAVSNTPIAPTDPSEWSSSTTIENEQYLFVRLTSSPDFDTSITASVVVGSVNGFFSVLTRQADALPEPFSWPDMFNVEPSTLITSNVSVEVSGLEPSFDIPLIVDNGQIAITNATITSPPSTGWISNTTVRNGDFVWVRQTSSPDFLGSTLTTVSIGDLDGTFLTRTRLGIQDWQDWNSDGSLIWSIPNAASMEIFVPDLSNTITSNAATWFDEFSGDNSNIAIQTLPMPNSMEIFVPDLSNTTTSNASTWFDEFSGDNSNIAIQTLPTPNSMEIFVPDLSNTTTSNAATWFDEFTEDNVSNVYTITFSNSMLVDIPNSALESNSITWYDGFNNDANAVVETIPLANTMVQFSVNSNIANVVVDDSNPPPDFNYENIVFDLSQTSYDNVSFDVSAQDPGFYGIDFSTDGTKMYILGHYTSRTVHQYTLTTPWQADTAVYDNIVISIASVETVPTGLTFSTDGTKMYVVGIVSDRIHQYNLSTPWDISTSSIQTSYLFGQDTIPHGIVFSPDGLRLYMVGNNTDRVYQYSLGTAWNVSTAFYTGSSVFIGSQDNEPYDIEFSNDGTKMFIIGLINDSIYEYVLSTPWNISTTTYNGILNVGSQDNTPLGLEFSSDGKKLFVAGRGSGVVYQYSMPSQRGVGRIGTNDTTGNVEMWNTLDDTVVTMRQAGNSFFTLPTGWQLYEAEPQSNGYTIFIFIDNNGDYVKYINNEAGSYVNHYVYSDPSVHANMLDLREQ